MNISITNACNRRCAYCFQKDWYLSKKANNAHDDSVIEMSVEDFDRLCVWGNRAKVFKLLGGEPLLHSQIDKLLEVAFQRKREIVFISNISVDEEVFDKVAPYFYDESSCVRSFLINTDYPSSQEEIFKRNLRKLCETKLSLAFSTTLLPGPAEVEKSRQRIEELVNIYKDVRGTVSGLRIRLAPFCPNPTNSTGFTIYDFTDDVVNFVNSLFPLGIEQYGFDCPVNLCELRSDFVDTCRKIGIKIRTERCSPESGMPFDVLVDHSVIWCSSANFIKLEDWRDYDNFDVARYELSRRYYDWWRAHSENTKCMSCDKHGPGYCSGFCIAKTQNMQQEDNTIAIKQL